MLGYSGEKIFTLRYGFLDFVTNKENCTRLKIRTKYFLHSYPRDEKLIKGKINYRMYLKGDAA